MISFTDEQRYYFYPYPMDMRKDIDTLGDVVRTQMMQDPYIRNGVFIFMSRDRRKMKILYRGLKRFELTKIRLDEDKFLSPEFDEESSCYKIRWSDYVALTEGVQATKIHVRNTLMI